MEQKTGKAFFLMVWMSMYAICLMAQSEQRIQVLRYNGVKEKTPLGGVMVAAANAGTSISDAEGQLTLQFRTLKIGDPVQFRRIEVDGYEVMNTDVVESMHIVNGMLTIVMCERAELAHIRDGYRSAAAQRYARQLEQAEAEVERLRSAGKLAEADYNRRLDALEEEYDEKLSRLESYIDKFARIDLSTLDATEQQVINLVQEGDFEQALTLYDQQHLTERLQQTTHDLMQLSDTRRKIQVAEQQKEDERQHLRASIDRQIALLRMAAGEANYQRAHELLQQTLEADPLDMDVRRAYAKSLIELDRWPEAALVIEQGLTLTTDVVEQILLQIALQEGYWQDADEDQALHQSEIARSLMLPLMDQQTAIRTRALPEVANFQIRYHLMRGDMKRCQEMEQLVVQHWEPDTLHASSLLFYQELLGAMSEYYSLRADHAKSLWAVDQSIALGEVYHRQYSGSGGLLHYSYAEACSSYALEGRWPQARQAARRSVELCQHLLKGRRSNLRMLQVESCLFLVSDALVSIGAMQLADSIMQAEEANPVFQEMKQRLQGQPDPYRPFYLVSKVQVCLHQAQHLHEAGREAEAADLLTRARELSATIETELPLTDDGEEAAAYMLPALHAWLAQASRDYTAAEQHYQKAIDVCESQYRATQSAWDADNVCRYLLQMAEMKTRQADNKGLQRCLRRAEEYAAFESNRMRIKELREK